MKLSKKYSFLHRYCCFSCFNFLWLSFVLLFSFLRSSWNSTLHSYPFSQTYTSKNPFPRALIPTPHIFNNCKFLFQSFYHWKFAIQSSISNSDPKAKNRITRRSRRTSSPCFLTLHLPYTCRAAAYVRARAAEDLLLLLVDALSGSRCNYSTTYPAGISRP